MILHLLGLPHTVTDSAHSHCAYTGKVLRFPAMMQPLGYEVIHYGAGDAEVDCEHVSIMSREEQDDLRGHKGADPKRFVGDDCNTDSPLYEEFNRRLRKQLAARVGRGPEHMVLLPFGHGHWQAVQDIPSDQLVESGIGYPTLYHRSRHHIFESYAWLHWHFGKAGRNEGHSYEWVIPNYFDPVEWNFDPEGQPGTVVFFGRLCQAKGIDTVWEVAKLRPDLHFIFCGQGDPEKWLTLPNIEYRPPISGRARSDLLGSARAVLMPTKFIEPFGGVAVEAQLCGTPVLASPWGAFPETIEDGRTGFLCHTLGDWLAALDRTLTLDRPFIRERAVARYSPERVGPKYDRAFRQIADLWGSGWPTPRSSLGPVKVTTSIRSG